MGDPAQKERMRKVVVSMNVALDGVMEAPETWYFPVLERRPALGRLNYAPYSGRTRPTSQTSSSG